VLSLWESLVIASAHYAKGLAALSVTLLVIGLSWPLIRANPLQKRAQKLMALSSQSTEMLADRQSVQSLKAALYQAYKSLAEVLLERIQLVRARRDAGSQAQYLYRAGFRGPSAVTVFYSVRFAAAALAGGLASAYLHLVSSTGQPAALVIGVAGIAAMGGFYLPVLLLKNLIDKRVNEVRRYWPDALDLMIICVESGLSIEAAMRKVAAEISRQSLVLAEELTITTAELTYLQDRRAAYERLSERLELPDVRSVVISLIQAEKYGTPIGKALRVLAKENRETRMAVAEKRATALGPKLTVPMIVFFLPVLFAVIISPVFLRLMS